MRTAAEEWVKILPCYTLIIEKKEWQINFLVSSPLGQDVMLQSPCVSFSIAFANENRVVFIWVWGVIAFVSLRFTIVLAPLFHPIGSKTKINLILFTHVFPRLASATCIFDWFTVCVLYDWLEFPTLGVSYLYFWLVHCLCPLWLARVSRAWRHLHVFLVGSLSVCFVIGKSYYFGFGFMTLNWKRLYVSMHLIYWIRYLLICLHLS